MHKSPSLFFDILGEEDAARRDEKIRRASFEIKKDLATGAPRAHNGVAKGAAAAAAAANGADGPASPPAGAAARAGSLQSPFQQQQEQQAPSATAEQQQQAVAAAGRPLVLSPQEVLQELLGDLFIPPSRLAMGELLGQGGFADVHAAELADPLLPSFSEPVAVKRLRPDVLKSPDDLREFLTEANLLRKLQHRNIVRLRGVGANDLTDLVSMRESMFVVQEFMAGGDLKALVMDAMTRPFDPPYTKPAAFTWAMQIAEAMHYLHSVCSPMIIHRDLKLDNVLLTGGSMHERVAKLADFGLHKRVRKMTSSGALVSWNQETTYRGDLYEKSYYGGKLYLNGKSAMSVASSMQGDDSTHGGVGGSTHGGGGSSWHRGGAAAAALAAASSGGGSSHHGSAAATAGDSSVGGAASRAGSLKPPLPPGGGLPRVPSKAALGGGGGGMQQPGQLSNSVASLQSTGDGSTGRASSGGGDAGDGQQEQQVLYGAVRAKSQGLLEKQEFVAQVLSVPSAKSAVWQQQGGLEGSTDHEVARTFAAVQALEGSVRAGSAFYKQPPQQQQPAVVVSSSSSKGSQSQRRTLRKQKSELCPQLVQQLQSGLAGAGSDSQKFIEATQKVGSVAYMAPEVLTGHQYNEKIDVFAFGIILYELLAGVIIAQRVALAGEHSELLDYAREVANGHREPIPAHWPAGVRSLVASCWAQEPRKRPAFKQVLKQLYALKQAGVDEEMDRLRPNSNYNPVTDCGCSIM